MFLTALDHLKLPDPNGALAVNKNTSDDILSYAAEILSKGTTHPAFYNDDAIVESFVKNYGCNRAEAADFIHSTCAEMTIAGKSKGYTTPFQADLPHFLVEAVKINPDETDINRILSSFSDILHERVKNAAHLYSMRLLEASRMGNGPMRICAFIDDCIAKGKSIYDGGERYTFLQPIFIGFSTMVDSLYAYKVLVLDEKKFTGKEFISVIESDYDNNEELRQQIINRVDHYGNDIESIDSLASRVSDIITEIMKADDIPMGSIMMPGTFSYINHATKGSVMGATFDGRKSGYSYSDGCSPVQGRDTNGPTAMVNSLTSWDQSEFLGGMVVNIKFNPEHLTRDNSSVFISVLKTFMQRGGLEMQVNVVDRNTLLDAVKHPKEHKDLIVRIGGYSDYFIRLTPTLRQEVIDRMEY